MKRVATIFGLFVLLAGAASAAEEFHKWQDKDGVWHYSKAPPKDQASTTVVVSGTRPFTAVTPKPEPAEPAPEAPGATDPAAAAAPSAEIAKALAAKRTAECEQAKANVATLENFKGVRKDKDGDGTAETLSEDEQSAELINARADLGTYCGGT